MGNRGKNTGRTDSLRKLAEDQLDKQNGDIIHSSAIADNLKLFRELQVYQIELEMQNEELNKAHSNLETFQKKYTEIIDFAPNSYFTLNDKGIIQEANLSGTKLLGINRISLIGDTFTRFIHRDELEIFKTHWNNLFQSKEHQVCELRISGHDGNLLYARLDLAFIDTSAISQVLIVITDISLQKKIEETQSFLLECSWSKAGRDFFEVLAEYLATTLNMDYVCIDKLQDKALKARTLAIFFDGHHEVNVEYALYDTPCGQVVGQHVCCFPSKVRHQFPNDIVLQEMAAESYVGLTLWSSDGTPIGLIAVIGRNPLTDTKQAEIVLKQVSIRAASELEHRLTEEQLSYQANLINNVSDAVISTDANFVIIGWNKAAEKIYGWRQDEVIGLQTYKILGTEYPEGITREEAARQLHEKEFWAAEVVQKRKDSASIYISSSVTAIKNDTGQIERVLAVNRDITDRKLAEAEIGKTNERLKLALQASNSGTWDWDIESDTYFWSEEFLQVFGLNQDTTPGFEVWLNALHPDDREISTKLIQDSLKQGTDLVNDHRIVLSNGEIRWIRSTGKTIFSHDKPLRMLGLCTDITRQKKAEEALRESEEKFRAIFENNASAMFIVEEDTTLVMVNEAFGHLVGCTKEEVIGTSWARLLPPEELERIKEYNRLRLINSKDAPLKYEFKFYRNSSELRYGLMSVSMIPGLKKMVGSFFDITERKKIEEALQESEKNLSKLYETMTEGLAVHEMIYDNSGKASDYIITSINPSYEKITGLNQAHIVGKRASEIYGTSSPPFIEIYEKVAGSGNPEIFETYFPPMDKHFHISTFSPDQGKFVTVFGDITDRKKAEDKLRESEERYKSIFVDSKSVMLLIDPSSADIIDANPAACNYYGWTYAELRKMKITEINILKKEETISIMQRAAAVKSNHFFFKHRLASGEIRDVEVYSGPVNFGQTQYLHSIVHDITERIQAENALKDSETKFSRYIDFAPHGIFVANESGEYVEINSAAMKMTGYQKEELLSMKITDMVPEESLSEAENHFITLTTHGFASGEMPFLKQDGSKGFWVVDAVKLSDTRFLGFTTETTERKLSELKLLEKDRMVRESQSAAHIASYSANLVTKTWQASDEIYRIFGINQTHPHTLEAWTASIHPDFREELQNDLQNAGPGEHSFDHEYKIIRANDGEERWVHGIGNFEYDEQKKPVKLIGTIQDVTEKKTAELALKNLIEDLEDIVNERTTELLLSHIAMQEAEEKYRTVADNTYDWETWMGRDGKFIYISPSCKKITGYAAEEFMNDPELFYKITHPDDREEIEKHTIDTLDGSVQDCSIDFRIINHEGETRWIGHNCHPVFNKTGKFIGQRGSNRDITERKIAETVLIDSQRHLRELTHRMDVIAEEERIRIAREIHDELGHLLTALKYDMDDLTNNTELTTDLAKSEMQDMISIIDSLIDSVRKIATDLRPGILDHLGLFPALEWKIREFQKRTKICTHFNLDEADFSFGKNETTIIYRIVQEILTNVARHSQASKLWLETSKTDDCFVLSIKDDGVGFELTDKQQKGSLGLMGMHERAMSIGGEIHIESSPGQGTTVNLLLRKN